MGASSPTRPGGGRAAAKKAAADSDEEEEEEDDDDDSYHNPDQYGERGGGGQMGRGGCKDSWKCVGVGGGGEDVSAGRVLGPGAGAGLGVGPSPGARRSGPSAGVAANALVTTHGGVPGVLFPGNLSLPRLPPQSPPCPALPHAR